MRERKSKKGQITIFVILAIAIVAVLLILLLPNLDISGSAKAIDIEATKCVESGIEEALDLLMLQGGTINPVLYYNYQGEQIEYLCYTNQYHETCTMQKPLLKQSIESEIEKYIQPRAQKCIEDLKSSMQSKGYEVTTEGTGRANIRIVPDNILISFDLKLNLKKDDRTESYTNFNADISSKIYDLIMIASAISNWEARYGEAVPETFMVFYHNTQIEKKKQTDGTKIYIITDLISNKIFQFASRSLAWPPGY